MKLVAISDTHNRHMEFTIPRCDVLVHAGDFTKVGTLREILGFVNWLGRQPARDKILIAGNHDFTLDKNQHSFEPQTRQIFETECKNLGIHYLEDSSVTIEGVKFYGTPWTPYFFGWGFNGVDIDGLPENAPLLVDIFDKIEDDTNVIVCHGPVFGYVDKNSVDGRCGSKAMLERMKQLDKCRLHICGHIHEARGHETALDGKKVIDYINVSSLQRDYVTRNEPVVITLDEGGFVTDIEGYE